VIVHEEAATVGNESGISVTFLPIIILLPPSPIQNRLRCIVDVLLRRCRLVGMLSGLFTIQILEVYLLDHDGFRRDRQPMKHGIGVGGASGNNIAARHSSCWFGLRSFLARSLDMSIRSCCNRFRRLGVQLHLLATLTAVRVGILVVEIGDGRRIAQRVILQLASIRTTFIFSVIIHSPSTCKQVLPSM
jgi:hypothetical protein